MEFSINIADPHKPDVKEILDELSANLFNRFGSDGRNSFSDWQAKNPEYIFVVAKNNTEIVGCGAVRPVWERTGEIKRMYAKYQGEKIGKSILEFLEKSAKSVGYHRLVLETRAKNESAISFYVKLGYVKIPNYGKYIDRPEAVCFEKSL